MQKAWLQQHSRGLATTWRGLLFLCACGGPPVGFGDGLEDPDTGLVRFGYRDYDPGLGRFTAKDPLGDTGGDHDLYDYCLDDPVSMQDPLGLFLIPLAIIGGIKLAGLALGYLGLKGSAYVADKLNSAKSGQETTAASDAIDDVMPYAAEVSSASALAVAPVASPELIPMAARGAGMLKEKVEDLALRGGTAYQAERYLTSQRIQALGERITDLAQRAGAVAQSRPKLEKMIKFSGEAAEGAFNPNWPAAATGGGVVGFAASGAYKNREKISEFVQSIVKEAKTTSAAKANNPRYHWGRR